MTWSDIPERAVADLFAQAVPGSHPVIAEERERIARDLVAAQTHLALPS